MWTGVKKINYSYICNQSSSLNLQTFNKKFLVSLILLCSGLFHPNNCFDFWSWICLGTSISHLIWKLACLDFPVVNLINTAWFVERTLFGESFWPTLRCWALRKLEAEERQLRFVQSLYRNLNRYFPAES